MQLDLDSLVFGGIMCGFRRLERLGPRKMPNKGTEYLGRDKSFAAAQNKRFVNVLLRAIFHPLLASYKQDSRASIFKYN